ncbi:MAG: VOC family protein, partial [bacterium]|nr:VOC family protein [bacterium]
MTLPYTKELTLAMPVTNLDASIEWYTGILGFELLYK